MIKEVFENFLNGLKGDLPILTNNKYSFLILFLFVVSVIVSIIYKMDKNKIIMNQNPFTHLFQETIDNLGKRERSICEYLWKTEGILKEKLSEDLGLNEIDVKNSLKLLEKRQVIKERKTQNDKIYLSEWLR